MLNLKIKNNWTLSELEQIYNLPFNDLIWKSHKLHREFHDPNKIQISTLMSVKTGGCPEDCKYCSQSIRYETEINIENTLPLKEVITQAKQAKENGASRFCMGAAWRNLNNNNLSKIKEMIVEVKKLGLETCVTLGMLTEEQAIELKKSGLDYYNHNLDTSEEYYKKVVTTRSYKDRPNTNEKNTHESCFPVRFRIYTMFYKAVVLISFPTIPQGKQRWYKNYSWCP